MENLVLIFALVFELARPQKFGNAQTNRHFDKTVIISKNIIFSMFTYQSFFVGRNTMVSSNFFFIKIVSTVFETFRKNEAQKKDTFFIYDYNTSPYLYGKVKTFSDMDRRKLAYLLFTVYLGHPVYIYRYLLNRYYGMPQKKRSLVDVVACGVLLLSIQQQPHLQLQRFHKLFFTTLQEDFR